MAVYGAPKMGIKTTIKEDGRMSIDGYVLHKADGTTEEIEV